MPPENAESETQEPAKRRRRVIFPWVWLGLLAALRLAIEFAGFTVDIRVGANIIGPLLAVLGLALWYAIRGRGPVWLRLAIGVAPFAALAIFNSLYAMQFNGAGEIVGLMRRGDVKADELLAGVDVVSEEDGVTDWGPGEYNYPRFLGEGAWAEAVGPPIAVDWETNPPQELWRREVGAGWSAFAVYGKYAITQEQRGEDELVVCYRVETGEPVWSHADKARFDPTDFQGNMGRQGPRATPTIVGDRVYTQGAQGMVKCLDARTGQPIWDVDTIAEYKAELIVWGKSGSPLFVPASNDGVERDLVVVNVGAPAEATEGFDASLVAFDAETGEEVWSNGSRQTSYASPELVTLHGERVILQTVDDYLMAHRVADGSVLFEHPWYGSSDNMPTCSQPIELPGDQILLTKGYSHGSSLLQVIRDGDAWSAENVWTPPIQRVLQTKFSNTVVRGDYAYAMDGDDLQCIEIATGKKQWSSRRRPKLGFGQVLLVGDYILVMTEEIGEVVLVDASPERYREVASLKVLAEKETCWNNPVIVGDVLLVRNAVEAAAYRLPLATD
ncbi:PQQ-binding-like beta-propeller repeat protein [Botrimarina mediterranea]|uniref:Outer membrane biogenesis protein BamB n=1 Tax=Botrimarina mediterranea TaxID=2528022 RepID=A0A518K8M3_9BACT|nr:PQQ-binding-like beta-propeller repeat protein [Botrimarina mediterranea]QDV74140.1 outer membrane biogenesis protein BamB [Botrimarina mediterranea]QDV78771.1 outer membrane biogenesis protein BamB [Planctomycetes bacterium K2D]